MVWAQFLRVWSGHSFFIQEKEKIHVPANIHSLFVLRKVEICACLIGHYARVQNVPTFSFYSMQNDRYVSHLCGKLFS